MRLRSAAAAGALALALTGCGGSGGGHGDLAWQKDPQVFRPAGLPHDRIVVGTVRNDSLRPIRLLASKIVVRDAQGRALEGSAGFTASYAHGLFGAFPATRVLPTEELVRLGRLVDLKPGATAPFYAAWRLRSTSREPVLIDYGTGTLTVPKRVRSAAP